MKRIFAMLMVAIFMVSAMIVMTAPAFAKITPARCETSSGQTPPGQQPVCKGGGLEQKPATNPAGHAPPGQQP